MKDTDEVWLRTYTTVLGSLLADNLEDDEKLDLQEEAKLFAEQAVWNFQDFQRKQRS